MVLLGQLSFSQLANFMSSLDHFLLYASKQIVSDKISWSSTRFE